MGADDSEKPIRVWADFNGVFGDILCLSHRDTAPDENNNPVQLREGMVVTAFMEDGDEHGNRDDIFASGVVEPSPPNLQRHGSKWVLRIDENGIRHESDVRTD